MRFGLRARIVLTVIGILTGAFIVIALGSQRIATRVITPGLDAPSVAPIATRTATWFATHHSWTGADRILAQLAPSPFALIIVDANEVRASSSPELDGAIVVRENDELRITPQSKTAMDGRNVMLRFHGAPKANVILRGRIVGTVMLIPTTAMMPATLPEASDAAFRQRFLALFAATALAAVMIAFVLAAYIVRPIRELTVAAQTASSSSLPSVSERSHDELGDLARAFNALGRRLVLSEAARQNVVSDVSHELRTPLTNLRCALESFQDGIDEPSPQALASVLADVLLLQRLVTDLHALRSGADVLPIDRIPTDIEEEARSSVLAFSERAAARNVRIEVTSQERIPFVSCDPVRVRQVFQNLIENALRYGRVDGRVTVALAHDRGAVRVTVSDDGAGFPASEESAIFERLYRTDTSRSRATGGAGLGLAIVKQLVETHGGHVGASGGDGRGASVWFSLPVSAAESSVQSPLLTGPGRSDR